MNAITGKFESNSSWSLGLRELALKFLGEQLQNLPRAQKICVDDQLWIEEIFFCRAAQEGLRMSIRSESALQTVETYFSGSKLDDAVAYLEWLEDNRIPDLLKICRVATERLDLSMDQGRIRAELLLCRCIAQVLGRLRAVVSQGAAKMLPSQPLILQEFLTSPSSDLARSQLEVRSEWAGSEGVGDCWGRAHSLTLAGNARLSTTVGGKVDRSLEWSLPFQNSTMLQSKRLQMAVMTASELAEEFILASPKVSRRTAGTIEADGTKPWCEKSRQQFRSAARLFTKFLGSVPFFQASHQDFVAFYKLLLSLPCDHHTLLADEERTLEAIIQRAESSLQRRPAPRLKPATAQRHLHCLRLLRAWLATAFHLPIVHWHRLINGGARDHIAPNLSFDLVRELFELPIWTGAADYRGSPREGSTIWHSATYFVPLLLWYTGIARDALCAVELVDIVHVGNLVCIRVRPGVGGVVHDRGFARLIPLHSEILRLGFLDYVDALRAEGETLLFPELRRASGQIAADVFSSRHWRNIRSALPEIPKNLGPGAIRDAAKKALEDQDVAEDKLRDLYGVRGDNQIDLCYSKVTPPDHLAVLVAKIPIVTAHIDARPIRLLPAEARTPTAARIAPRVQVRIDQERALRGVLDE